MLHQYIRGSVPFRALKENLARGEDAPLHGIIPAFTPYALSAVYRVVPSSLIVPVADEETARSLLNDMRAVLPEEETTFLPVSGVGPYEAASPSASVINHRMRILYDMRRGEKRLVLVPCAVLLDRWLSLRDFQRFTFCFQVGKRVELEEVTHLLSHLGYVKVSKIDYEGEYSVRGGILDIYSPAEPDPVRIDFFDDEIESVRYFDLVDQRSGEAIDDFTVLPLRSVVLTDERVAEFKQRLAEIRKTGPSAYAERLNDLEERIEQFQYVNGIEQFRPLLANDTASLFDYLPEETTVALPRDGEIADRLRRVYEGITARYHELGRDDPLRFPPSQLYFPVDEVRAKWDRMRSVSYSAFGGEPEHTLRAAEPAQYGGMLDRFIRDAQSSIAAGERVIVLCGTADHAERMAVILAELSPEMVDETGSDLPPGVYISVSDYSAGFRLENAKVTVLTEVELFGKKRLKRRQRLRRKHEHTKGIDSFLDLTEGDYVVHVDHGIGVYRGIQRLRAADTEKDYLQLEYRDKDKLYVPISQIGMVQRYIGQYGKAVTLDRLGGRTWTKAKRRVKEGAEKMAAELIAAHARRKRRSGIPFRRDDRLMYEFEAAFPYYETQDQLDAIAAVKSELESSRCMDRLICGDVGFGKTEVAMRAVFKVVSSGYQAAMLVPTTVLVQQHMETFTERFQHFPLTIERLSRFNTAAEIRQIRQRLLDGEIDVIIGTHKLLGKHIRFKQLGLLVVDEEQRFGVGHKETIKSWKENVDVLTLTATPIPRTLNQAMAGLKDVSVIDTPPENRHSILTHIVEFDDTVIREAVHRELRREGQVYFLHNRVRTIHETAAYLEQLVPEARIRTAHGRMDKEGLERIMTAFHRREFDVLVCTTIIESGVDIPNVNTMFIDRADRFGLSQLYQIRGRVGRSDRQAYAYLMYHRRQPLSELARRRLYTIDEYTELGSGFKIALRDLEIRGAGNLLGPEQHGMMVSVGFEMYCKLLEEAVADLEGRSLETPREDPLIDLPIPAFIESDYVADKDRVVEIYMKVNRAATLPELDEVRREVEDRFGRIPDSLQNIFLIIEMKVRAKNACVVRMALQEDRIVFTFHAPTETITARLMRKVATNPAAMMVDPANPAELVVRSNDDTYGKIDFCRGFLAELVEP